MIADGILFHEAHINSNMAVDETVAMVCVHAEWFEE